MPKKNNSLVNRLSQIVIKFLQKESEYLKCMEDRLANERSMLFLMKTSKLEHHQMLREDRQMLCEMRRRNSHDRRYILYIKYALRFLGSTLFLLVKLLDILIELFKPLNDKSRNEISSRMIFRLSNLLFEEDVRSVLEIQIDRELKSVKSPSIRRVKVFRLFLDSLWGTKIVPYFQNKFLPSRKETDRS